MTAEINLTGQKFGTLSVLGRVDESPEYHGQVAWACQCECGNVCVVVGRDLRVGHTKSCGCKKAEMIRAANTTHGGSRGRHPEYRIWGEMLQRCENPNSNRYYTHGARGIKVCERWRHSYTAFIEDMGRRPAKELTLERRDNDGNYEPGNCYWATRVEQARNRRNSLSITIGGQTKPLLVWAEETGIKYATIYYRLKAGWTPEEAVGIA